MAPKTKVNVYNWNVKCGMATGVFYCLGYGLFSQTVLPSFLLFVGGSNLAIGWAEGLQGLATLFSALPAGYLADKVSRTACIRLGCCMWVITATCLCAAVVKAEPNSAPAYNLICAALVFQGICDGIMLGPLVALMDDSVPAGYRSDVESANGVACTLATAVGPFIGALMFAHTGNEWSISTMKMVIVTGAIVGQGANVCAFMMRNDMALGLDSEAVHLQEGLLDKVEGAQGEDEKLQEKEEEEAKASKRTCFGMIGPSSVIYILFASDLIMGLGAGMTVKFFPVFFQSVGHVSPTVVNGAFSALGGLTAIGTIVAQRLSKRFGRLQVVIPAMCAGVVCTALMGALKPLYTQVYVMIPLFMIRCTCMWSTGSLQGSVVADYTPKSQRARWKALNSVLGVGWSGSAALGGWLIDHYGYGPCFVVTAMFQACAIPFLVLLLPHVAMETDLADAIDKRHEKDNTTPIMTPVMKTMKSN